MKRLFGDGVGFSSVPGMEPDTISKYAVNILLDFKPDESPIRPEAAEILRRRAPGSQPCGPLPAHRNPRRRSRLRAKEDRSVA